MTLAVLPTMWIPCVTTTSLMQLHSPGVFVAVLVAVGVLVGVLVIVGVLVGVFVAIGVLVGVFVRVAVKPGVGVLVGTFSLNELLQAFTLVPCTLKKFFTP